MLLMIMTLEALSALEAVDTTIAMNRQVAATKYLSHYQPYQRHTYDK